MNEEEKKRLDESEPQTETDAEQTPPIPESEAAESSSECEEEEEMEDAAVSEDENGDESVPEPEAEQPQQEPQQEPQPQQQPMEKMLTQSQVNELVGRARQEGRESALKELYGRYGVSGDSELNDVFGRGQAYLTLDDDFKAEQSSNKALLAENALLKTKVDESRWEDIKAILGSKNMDITPENIEAEIPTHPEWRQTVVAQQQQQAQAQPQQDSLQPQQQPQQAVLRKLGSESTAKDGGNGDDEESEQERAMKLFGFNKEKRKGEKRIMTLEEAKAAIEDLKAQGETEDDILKVLYGMFTEDKLSLSDLRTFIGILGYEFTEEFEAMSDEDKKTKGWEQEDDPEKSGVDKEEIEKAKEFGDDEGEEKEPEEPEEESEDDEKKRAMKLFGLDK